MPAIPPEFDRRPGAVKESVPELEAHPAAEIFPMMAGDDFEQLKKSIKELGQQEPIILFQGQILDGRNRYRACCELGIDAVTKDELDNVDPIACVITRNIHRRHLDESQRAMIASKLANLAHGQRADRVEGPIGLSTAADQLKVGKTSVKRAKTVRENGEPELVKAVEQGQVSVSVAVRAVDLEPYEQRQVASAEKPHVEIKKLQRQKREQALADRTARATETFGSKRYGVLLAYPPWLFDTWSEAGKGRAAENHYPVMDKEQLLKLFDKVGKEVAADDAVLFLWATAPKLDLAFACMKTAGFRYVTQAVWVKDRTGTGYWVRNQHEILLIGKRGDIPAPAPGTQLPSVIQAPVGRHSEKPVAAHKMIEVYFPTTPKIELFARAARDGWDAWGNEAPLEEAV